jgi:hypothetical protein
MEVDLTRAPACFQASTSPATSGRLSGGLADLRRALACSQSTLPRSAAILSPRLVSLTVAGILIISGAALGGLALAG